MTLRHAIPTYPTLARLCGLVLLLLAAPLALAQVPTLLETFEAPEPDIDLLDFGDVIVPLGDVDGDGVPDLAVGGSAARPGGVIDVGRAYVISGANGSVIHTLEAPNAVQQGIFGDHIANLGDLDDDGIDDFVVTEQGATFDGEDTGAAYVYSGATGEILYPLTSPTPEDGGDFGSAAANAGDVDGDGLNDILIGALNENDAPSGGGSGQVHVFSGTDGALIRTITRPFTPGGGVFSFFGREVYLAGDLDGDGLRDHAVFTRFEGQGRVDFFSAADGTPIDFLQPSFTSGAGEFGQALIPIPDLTGDGTDELLISAPQAEIISPFPPRVGRGVIQLYDGATRALIREFRPGAQAGMEPEATGQSLALGEDLDGDGVRDFYAGSPGADEPGGPTGVNNGRVYIFSTGGGTLLGQLSSPNPARIGIFGDALAMADLTGDGTDELLVGAPRENMTDGRVYVYEQNPATPIVMDGSFEATDPETGQNPFWTQFGIPSNPICTVERCGPNEGIEAFDGDWFVFFGRSNDGTSGFVEQDVTIPDSVNTLSFYLKIVPGSGGFVRALIDGNILFEATPADADTYEGYQRVNVNIGAFADGGEHTLRFQSATPSASPPNPTFFFVDLVSITNRVGTAAIVISPSPFNFGQVPIGTVAEIEGTISNPGGDPLVVDSVTVTQAPTSPDPDPPITTDLVTPLTVPAGESITFTVSYAPTAAVTSIAEINFFSNASSSPNEVLAGGTGIDVTNPAFSVEPDSLDFELDAGDVSEAQTLTLSNTGDDVGTFAITTTITPPTALVPTTFTPADRLRPAADFVRGETPSVVRRTTQRGSGGDLIADGSFEATPDDAERDNPFWNEFSAQIGSPFCNEACFDVDIARTGDWAAIFGFDEVLGTDFIEQEVELEAQSYDLSFFYAGGTDRDTDSVEEAEAFFRIFLDDELIYELSSAEAQDFTLDYRPLTVAFDVETAGTKTLRFELEQIVADDDVMQIIFDDVSLAPSTLVIDIDPTSGTVEAGGTQEITVAADATQATPGVYTAEIRIDTDDPEAPAIFVPVTVTVEGVVVPPVAEVDPEELDFQLEQDETESQTLTISNAGAEGAGALTYEIAVTAARQAGTLIAHEGTQARTLGNSGETALHGAPVASRSGLGLAHADGSTLNGPWFETTGDPITYARSGGVTITHSESQEIVPLTAIACSNQTTGFTSPNSFWRVFDLDEFDLTGGFDVTGVEIGIEAVNLTGGTVESTVNLYSLDGPFTRANLTLVGSATYELQGTEDGTIVEVPITGSVESGGTLVVEWSVPDLRSGQPVTGSVFYGANSAGQTAPTYISADACNITEPTDLAAVGGGFPDVHWVLNVTGTTEVGGDLLISVDPESGSIAQGESDEITVTADATGAEPGIYEFDVIITTNDPATPTITVGVTVEVLPTVANEDDAVPTVFALRAAYPNPFASATTIGYDLPEAAHVTVAVYDAVGRRVATLVDAEQGVGRYEAEWDARSLASGVYLYRIQAGSYAKTMKVSLVR